MRALLGLVFNVFLLVTFPILFIVILGLAFTVGLLWQVFGDALKGR